MRKALTTGFIVVGLALMLLGYALAAPWSWATEADSNPTVDFAPVIFVAGVIVLFSSALIYELLPSKQT